MRLYRVNLRGDIKRYNPSYVVAKDPSSAYEIVKAELDRLDYGFYMNRQLRSVELIAEANEHTLLESRLFLGNQA